MTDYTAGDAALFTHVERLLHERIGLDVTTVGSSLVQRAVQRRMRTHGTTEVAAYVSRIAQDEQELQELVEAVVVPETYFFREPDALDMLASLVTSGTVAATPSNPLRVLSAPCSTGEEPYSIVMTLLAAGVSPLALAVDAVDVSHDAVRRARLAVYRSPSFRGGSFDWQPYFRTLASGERALHDTVRERVHIVQANLLDPSFRAPRPAYDVVFCRNLLIYFDTDTQTRVLSTLTSLLAPTGLLVVGAADTFAVRRAGFVPAVGAERAFLFTYRGVAAVPEVAERVRPVPPRARTARLAVRASSVRAPAIKAHRTPPPAGDEPAAATESVLTAVARLANEGRLAEAVAMGEATIRGDDRSAELMALLGATTAALGDEVRAESYYRRALYLDPAHAEALLHLALLLDGRGDADGALRLRSRARRGLASARGPIT